MKHLQALHAGQSIMPNNVYHKAACVHQSPFNKSPAAVLRLLGLPGHATAEHKVPDQDGPYCSFWIPA